MVKKHIPNFITSLNLASGFVAIMFAVNNNLVTASWIILMAMIFDYLDGFFARLLNAYSEIGKELDSLADMVSFGISPAIIIFSLLKESLLIPGSSAGKTYTLTTSIILGSIRLVSVEIFMGP